VHHPHIVHGSEPNRSQYRRCGLDIGYMPASVSIHNEALYQNPILVRGNAPGDRQYQPWPEVRPGETISFSGDAHWNRKAAEHNAGFQHLQNADKDPLTLTSRMMERLSSGTVKTGTRS
jgi:phytanoyl-CoA hydroxylase